jgi:hypothetical protein
MAYIPSGSTKHQIALLALLIPGDVCAYYNIGGDDYKKAVEYLIHALTPNERKFMYQLFEHNFAELWDLIAVCFLQLAR